MSRTLGSMRDGFDRLASSLWPGRCVSCSTLLRPGEDLACEDCSTTIFELDVQLEPPSGLDECWAAYRYRGAVQDALQAWKYNGRMAVGRALGRRLIQRFEQTGPSIPASVTVVPVPLHADRVRERGFDQTRALANRIAHHLGRSATLRVRGLERTRHTSAQAGLDRNGRIQNVAGAFRATDALSGTTLLIDDVVTTGATAAACAAALKVAGAERVVALAVARAADERYDDVSLSIQT